MTEITVDPVWGYRRVHPLPQEDEVSQFYESAYYDSMRDGSRAPDLARLRSQTDGAAAERHWLEQTVFRDFIDWSNSANGGSGSVLEVGCGTGDLLEAFASAGWKARGLELAEAPVEDCLARGLDVRREHLSEFVESNEAQLDVVVMRFLLEHVPDPAGVIRDAGRALRSGGALIVEVPNDFNALQQAACEELDLDPWWIRVPDHLNYFDFDSLRHLLDRLGFEVERMSASFPMEFFLLMGEVYVRDPQVGAHCHEKRRTLERRLPTDVRRTLATAFAQVGLGRSCVVVARRA